MTSIAESKQAGRLRRLRWQLWKSAVREFITESRLRLALVSVLTLFLWAIAYLLFHEGFSLLRTAAGNSPDLVARIVHAVYNAFFLSLLIMIGVSSAILYYALLYKSPDVRLLLTTPLEPGRIAVFKYHDATWLASWGFLLLGSPLLIAYGTVNEAGLPYYALLGPFLFAFAAVASAAGAIACLLAIRIPRPARRLLGALLAGVLAIGFCLGIYSVLADQQVDVLSAFWLQQQLGRLSLAERQLLPSWWLSTGLLEAAHGRAVVNDAAGFLVLLASTALVGELAVERLAARWLRKTFDSEAGQTSGNISLFASAVDRWIRRLLAPFPRELRTLLEKDLKLFRRDPLQWSQFLMFFGLLVLYFFYVRRFEYGDAFRAWVVAIGFVNLAVVGLIMATFATRFVFPMISIEGQRFWILGTAPINRDAILYGKFVFAFAVGWLPSSLLVLLSDLALKIHIVSAWQLVSHQILCLAMALGLAAMAVGLGARLPNLREPSPAKIAAGFGGTMTLIVSALFVTVIVLAPALPTHLAIVPSPLRDVKILGLSWDGLACCAVALSVGISLIVTVVCLRMGVRSFRLMQQTG